MGAVHLLSVIGLLMCGIVGEGAVHAVSPLKESKAQTVWLHHAGPAAAQSPPGFVAAQGYMSPIYGERPPSSPSAEAVGGNESQPPEEPAPPGETPAPWSKFAQVKNAMWAASMVVGSVHANSFLFPAQGSAPSASASTNRTRSATSSFTSITQLPSTAFACTNSEAAASCPAEARAPPALHSNGGGGRLGNMLLHAARHLGAHPECKLDVTLDS